MGSMDVGLPEAEAYSARRHSQSLDCMEARHPLGVSHRHHSRRSAGAFCPHDHIASMGEIEEDHPEHVTRRQCPHSHLALGNLVSLPNVEQPQGMTFALVPGDPSGGCKLKHPVMDSHGKIMDCQRPSSESHRPEGVKKFTEAERCPFSKRPIEHASIHGKAAQHQYVQAGIVPPLPTPPMSKADLLKQSSGGSAPQSQNLYFVWSDPVVPQMRTRRFDTARNFGMHYGNDGPAPRKVFHVNRPLISPRRPVPPDLLSSPGAGRPSGDWRGGGELS